MPNWALKTNAENEGEIMDLQLRTHEMDGATVVEVGGEVELHSANQLRDELARAASAAEHPCVVVDLSRVTFIDSTGLGVVVGAFKRVRERGKLSIVCPQRSVRRVFEITGLLHILPFHDSVSAAVQACNTETPTVNAPSSSTRSSSASDEPELQTASVGATKTSDISGDAAAGDFGGGRDG